MQQKSRILHSLIEKFRNAKNFQQKQDLDAILDLIRTTGYSNSQIYASLGEDAAAIRPNPNSSQLILLTTDAILSEFVEKSPWGAGFSAIYVGIEDILACGGQPIGASITISYNQENKGKEIFRGVLDATNRFRIPLIRGHTRTDSPNISLSSAIIGITDIQHFASVHRTQNDDILGFIFDPIGKPGKANRLYWDTITESNTETFFAKRAFVRTLIENGCIHTCKDISNGGILGTIYQICKYSQKGASVLLDIFEELTPFHQLGYNLDETLSLFLTSAYIITGPVDSEEKIRQKVINSGMQYYTIGRIISQPKIILQYGDALMDFLSLV